MQIELVTRYLIRSLLEECLDFLQSRMKLPLLTSGLMVSQLISLIVILFMRVQQVFYDLVKRRNLGACMKMVYQSTLSH